MGNIALRIWQIGMETAYGDGLNVNRELYPGAGSVLEKEIAFHTPELDMGSYDLARAGRFQQLIEAGVSISDMVLDTNMIIEFLRMAVSATPATGPEIGSTGAFTWAFEPGATLKSGAIEFDASGQVWKAVGCMVDELSISWAVNDPVSIAASIIAKQVSKGSLTGGASSFALIPLQGWEVMLYIAAAGTADPFAGSPTEGTLIGGEITINNNLTRRYFDDNVQTLGRLNRGKRSVEVSFTMDLGVNAMAQYDLWEAGTERTIGLRFGNNKQAGTDAGNKHRVDIIIPGVWTAQSLGDEDEASTLEFTLENVYNATTKAYSITVINTRGS